MDKKRDYDYFFNVNRTGLRLRAVSQLGSRGRSRLIDVVAHERILRSDSGTILVLARPTDKLSPEIFD
jgi:hypothetical protein